VHRQSHTESPILIVDDDPINVQLLLIVLESAGYANLHSTTESLLAVSLFSEVQPDLVITDLHMPFLDGFGLLTQLRQLRPDHADPAIVVLTCDSSSEAKQRALSLGATKYLTKPFNPDKLLQCLNDLLADRFEPPASVGSVFHGSLPTPGS